MQLRHVALQGYRYAIVYTVLHPALCVIWPAYIFLNIIRSHLHKDFCHLILAHIGGYFSQSLIHYGHKFSRVESLSFVEGCDEHRLHSLITPVVSCCRIVSYSGVANSLIAVQIVHAGGYYLIFLRKTFVHFIYLAVQHFDLNSADFVHQTADGIPGQCHALSDIEIQVAVQCSDALIHAAEGVCMIDLVKAGIINFEICTRLRLLIKYSYHSSFLHIILLICYHMSYSDQICIYTETVTLRKKTKEPFGLRSLCILFRCYSATAPIIMPAEAVPSETAMERSLFAMMSRGPSGGSRDAARSFCT